MRYISRFLAVPAGGLLLAAAVASPALAQSNDKGVLQQSVSGMAQLHQEMSSGQGRGMARMEELMDGNPGMARMHELMKDGNPGMTRMHKQIMSE